MFLGWSENRYLEAQYGQEGAEAGAETVPGASTTTWWLCLLVAVRKPCTGRSGEGGGLIYCISALFTKC